MAEFFRLVTPQDFFQIVQKSFKLKPSGTEIIPFTQSLDRVVAEDIISPLDLPPFSRSTVDGFAVRAKDTEGVSESLPGYLDVIGEIAMGEETNLELKRGQAVKISTGGMIPEGADGALMIEYTEYLDEKTIEFTSPIAKGENILLKGEDIERGEILFAKGHKIRAQDVGALAGLGIVEVKVFKKPQVAIFSTGDELVSPYSTPKNAQIRDINSYSLSAYLEKLGCLVKNSEIIKDSYDHLKRAIRSNLDADMILISGGSSVGVKDMTIDVLKSFDRGEVLVHGVSIKPGKPTILAMVNNIPIIGLPGHPASAWTIFHVIIRPILQVLRGEKELEQLKDYHFYKDKTLLPATLSRNLASERGKEQYIPVKVYYEQNKGYIAEPISGKSGMITTLVRANGLIRIDLHSEGLNQGDVVYVELF